MAEGKDPDQEPGYVRRLWDFIAHTDVELQEIGFHAYGASLMLELKNNPTFHQKAEAALRVRFQQFANEARTVMEQSILRLRQAPTTQAQRVVILADGLEKFTPLREEDRGAMEASVESVFVQHARLLHLPCHTIYTFPLWLRFRVAELGGLYDGSPTVLPMVKIALHDGTGYAAGDREAARAVRRRVRDLARVFGDDLDATLLPIVHASGGYPRDLLRMVRQLLIDARELPGRRARRRSA